MTHRPFKDAAERSEYLRQIGNIHRAWSLKHENDEGVFNIADSKPHNKDTGDTDYPIFYLDRSAPAETDNDYFKMVQAFEQEFFKEQ